MYAFIRGTVISSVPAVIETSGIGYRISLPQSVQLPPNGETVTLHLSHVVRETSQTLYGFNTSSDRDLFELLTLVSGIGPKIALGVVGNLPAHALQEAILQNNATLLSKIPGIGKKTAERLIMELRDKIAKLPCEQPTQALSGTANDGLQALLNLGYPLAKAQVAIEKALKKLEPQAELSTLITTALQNV